MAVCRDQVADRPSWSSRSPAQPTHHPTSHPAAERRPPGRHTAPAVAGRCWITFRRTLCALGRSLLPHPLPSKRQQRPRLRASGVACCTQPAHTACRTILACGHSLVSSTSMSPSALASASFNLSTSASRRGEGQCAIAVAREMLPYGGACLGHEPAPVPACPHLPRAVQQR